MVIILTVLILSFCAVVFMLAPHGYRFMWNDLHKQFEIFNFLGMSWKPNKFNIGKEEDDIVVQT